MMRPSIQGDQLDGREWNESRGNNMTKTVPPKDGLWRHYAVKTGNGNDSTVSPLARETLEEWKRLRLEWLEEFELEVTEEAPYRWWRWYDDVRAVVWSERRPLTAKLPSTPGIWPHDD